MPAPAAIVAVVSLESLSLIVSFPSPELIASDLADGEVNVILSLPVPVVMLVELRINGAAMFTVLSPSPAPIVSSDRDVFKTSILSEPLLLLIVS